MRQNQQDSLKKVDREELLLMLRKMAEENKQLRDENAWLREERQKLSAALADYRQREQQNQEENRQNVSFNDPPPLSWKENAPTYAGGADREESSSLAASMERLKQSVDVCNAILTRLCKNERY